MDKMRIKLTLMDVVVYFAIVFGITFLWQGLELLMYGEIQHRVVDDIIGLILLFSLLFNYMLFKMVRFLKKNLEEEVDFLYILSNLGFYMKAIDKILSDTIDNENGKETSTTKFTDIKQFATYIKAMNDTNMNYINDFFKSGDENKEKKEGKE